MKHSLQINTAWVPSILLLSFLYPLLFAQACVTPLDIGGKGQPCSSKGACMAGLTCDPQNVCQKTGGGDGGEDASSDAGQDASADAAPDASMDAMTDGSVDATLDGASDASSDASSDAGRDGALDGGSDSGEADGSTDAGWDGGTDGGLEQCKGRPDFTACSIPDAGYRYNICVSGVCVMPGCGDVSCNTPGPNFPAAPTTGSHYTKDTSVILEPVVHDTVTGLDWQGCSGGAKGMDCAQGGGQKWTWEGALAYCNTLKWGVYSDWRLPDNYEIQSIVDFAKVNPSINGTAFPGTPSYWFWTSSTGSVNPATAWNAYFSVAGLGAGNTKDIESYARCVRGGGSTVEAPRFTRSFPKTGQPVVYDRVTGLTWQGCAADLSGNDCSGGSKSTFTFPEVVNYCPSLDWGGFSSGWRIPTVNELAGLMSTRTYYPAIDSEAFPNTPTSPYVWAAQEGIYWTVDFYFGGVIQCQDKFLYHSVRCVR